jgi:dihydrofolate reductase
VARLSVVNNVTLDGVMQAPGRSDEDRRGGFAHGGWARPYSDPVMGEAMGRRMGGPGAMLLGRRTYEDFAAFWPKQKDNPYTPVLDATQKYVVSATLSEPLPWQNSTRLRGDVVKAVSELKRQIGNLTILGSGQLVRSLIPSGLIDEYVLLIHPLVLGVGGRLFPDGASAALRLADSITTTTGVLIATYQPA